MNAIDQARTFFSSHPDYNGVYVCQDGRTIPEAQMLKLCSSRTGQLVAISTVGFPVYVSRKRIANGGLDRHPGGGG
jgi:hypothetical protein